MNMVNIIEKKKAKQELTKEEIEFFIKGYTDGSIPDYQASALIMAICLNGMTADEIVSLTLSMAKSGETLDLSNISKNIVDKHSTGGVGDKVTLILMPIIAAIGIPVAKMSGRGLGFTGGTVDKLESIPGYNTKIDIEEFKRNIKDINISLIGQTLNLAPADKKIYALRDAIACTDSIPLIASSIMSKKIAAGANSILLDVTCGSGAFMRNKEEAKRLSKMMIRIGKWAKKETKCVITSMDEPLGYAIGNSLEVIETVNCLKGNMPPDIKEVVLTLGAYIMKLAKKGDNIIENKNILWKTVESGKAYKKFIELVKKQGGDISFIEDVQKFEKAKIVMPVLSEKDGYISKVDAKTVGNVSVRLGAGREKKEDDIDHAVGIILNKKVGDQVRKGEVLAYIHANNEEKATLSVEDLKFAFRVVNKKIVKPSSIIDIIE